MLHVVAGAYRAPGGSVGLDRHPLRVDREVDQVERNGRAGGGEQPLALAEDHGGDEQVDLVNEGRFRAAIGSGPAAVHLQLTPRLAELADGSRQVTGEHGRVRPLRVGERGRWQYGFLFKAAAIWWLPDLPQRR